MQVMCYLCSKNSSIETSIYPTFSCLNNAICLLQFAYYPSGVPSWLRACF